MKPETLFGFDYGVRRIGLAVCQSSLTSAECLATVPVRGNGPDWDQLDQLVNEWRPGRLIVGLPLHLDDRESEMSRLARRFGVQLGHRYTLPVDFVDERLSSDDAAVKLRQTTAPGKSVSNRRDKFRDQLSAVIILETYLNELK
ncbi:MAG: Holliday junction resolvase RuvX [Arenicellales bacterium]|nr:Holliday junction resolvase RuvX [Arenicellales bacterium]MDP6435354.1 Holliday junction resolvase RuvX [Arenicellales bacterium]MDP6672080.1 Holliday junction resolvase RuvX [Arenicellales bacterium]MDP6724936.1 Holliday junction resolvase RuvX [Arenicellales bacterium]MDP7521604.1 Holliday junction resolvase RuvX [Arenicellales bacterium]